MSATRCLDVLHELGQILERGPDTVSLAQDVVEVLENRMGYQHLALLVVADGDEGLEPLGLGTHGRDTEFLEADKAYVRSKCSSPGQGLTGWVAQHGRSARVGEVRVDPRYHGIRHEIRSELCVPLRVGRDVIGVLNTEATSEEAYSELDETFLEAAASHVALAVLHNQRALGTGRFASVRTDVPFLTSCSYCQRMRCAQGEWDTVDEILARHLGVRLSHGICPHCYDSLPELRE